MHKQKRQIARRLGLALVFFVSLISTGLGLSCLSLTAMAQTESIPTPTVPSWNRPNFHLYLVDERNAPVAGVRVQLYDLVVSGGKEDLFLLVEGVSNEQGRVSFDVVLYPLNKIYLLRLSEPDGAPVLPFDPNPQVPKPGLSIGQADPVTRELVPVDLTLGSVVYAVKYTLKPLVPLANPKPTATLAPGLPTPVPLPPSRRAIGRLAGEVGSWTYYPPYGSGDLALGGNAPGTVTGSPAPLVKPGIGIVPTATAAANVPATSGTASVVAGSPVASSTPKPTATLECRGCGTIATISPAVTGGTSSNVAATASVDNRNGGGRATATAFPPGVLTQRAEATAARANNPIPTAVTSTSVSVSPVSATVSVPSQPAPASTSSGGSPTATTVVAAGLESSLVSGEATATYNSAVLTATPTTLEVVAGTGVGASSPTTPGPGTGQTATNSPKTKSSAGDWLGWFWFGGLTLLVCVCVGGYFVIGRERVIELVQSLLRKIEQREKEK